MKAAYFGHSAFRLKTSVATILVDPFLTGNPHLKNADIDVTEISEGVTHILLTHGHVDHVGDTIEIAKRNGARVVCIAELGTWLVSQGVKNVTKANTGGTVRFGDFSVTLTQAMHSSSLAGSDGVPLYMGVANGLIIQESGGAVIYNMGDTDIFGDMQLISELYRPTIGFVPIGDHYTMGSKVAALACTRFFQFEKIVPTHWGTMPVLEPSPEKFIDEMRPHKVDVISPIIGKEFEL